MSPLFQAFTCASSTARIAGAFSALARSPSGGCAQDDSAATNATNATDATRATSDLDLDGGTNDPDPIFIFIKCHLAQTSERLPRSHGGGASISPHAAARDASHVRTSARIA